MRDTPFFTRKAAHCKNLARPFARPLPGNFLPLPATTFCTAGLLPIQLSIVFSGSAFLPARQRRVELSPPYHRRTISYPPFVCTQNPRTSISTCGVPGARCPARLAPMPAPANTGCKGTAMGGILQPVILWYFAGAGGQSFPRCTGTMLKTFLKRLFLPHVLQPRPPGTICPSWGCGGPHPKIGGQVPGRAADMVLQWTKKFSTPQLPIV